VIGLFYVELVEAHWSAMPGERSRGLSREPCVFCPRSNWHLIDGFQAHPKDFDLAPLNFSRLEGLPEFRHRSVPTPVVTPFKTGKVDIL
jgi:hypothetical protein